MTKEIRQLPRHEIIGDKISEPMLTILTEKLIEGEPELPPEVEVSPEIEEKIALISKAVDLFARNELGLDISSRLGTRSEIHFTSEEDFRGYCREHHSDNEPDGIKGINIGRHIIVPLAVEAIMLQTITHEMVHVVSASGWSLRYTNPQETIVRPRKYKKGYYPSSSRFPESLSAINEYITEKISLQVIADYWPQVGIDTNLEDKIEGYGKLMPIMDSAMQYAAQQLGESFEQMMLALERGMIVGDNKALRPLLAALGPEVAKELVHSEPYGPKMQEFSRKLGELSVARASR